MRKPSEFDNHPASYEMARSMGCFRAVCKWIVDGDTYDAYIDGGMGKYFYETIRLHDLDTAEIFHPSNAAERAHGMAAKARVTDLILDRPILIKTYKDAETFGRYVADVGLVTPNPVTVTDIAGTLRAEGFEKKASYL